jgi:hypothetical protein
MTRSVKSTQGFRNNSGSLAIFAPIRRLILAEYFGRRAPAGLTFEIDQPA